jgi:OOP family OmpA-OmpF porin
MQFDSRFFATLATAALLVGATAGSALAHGTSDNEVDRTGAYVAGSIGIGFWDGDEGEALSSLDRRGLIDADYSSIDFYDTDDTLIWGVFAGYQINKYFGLDAGYVDLGGFDGDLFRYPVPRTDTVSERDLDADTTGWQLMARFNAPAPMPFAPFHHEQLSLVFGGGILAYNLEYDIEGADRDPDEDGIAPVASAGLQYDGCNCGGLRLEYLHYFDVDDHDMNALMLSLLVRWENLLIGP